MILTQEQEMIRDSMRAFAQERLAPFAAEWDRDHTFPAQALKELGELGALGMCVPEEWGGAGMDYMSLVLTLEEIAAGDGATSTIVSVQNSLPCGIINKYGTDTQKEEWLKPLARGEKLGCFCLTEPHTGSDASAITTRADRDGNDFVLNGVKQFITTGKHAHMAIVFAVTDKAAGKKGISCFLVPTATPGYKVARIERKMGQHASDTAQIVFEDCRIPASALLGKEGEGYKIALSNLEAGRIGIAAQSVGMARAAFEAAVAYAKENGLDYDYNYSAAMTCNWYYTVQGKFAEGFMDLQTYQVYSENYLGGAHGMHYLIPNIINLKTGEIVTENELFKPGYVAPVTELIKSKLALDRGVEDINESVMFSEGLVPNGHCGVSGAGVTWYYQPYEIASYAEGIIEVTVFWIDLKPYLNPEFVKF